MHYKIRQKARCFLYGICDFLSLLPNNLRQELELKPIDDKPLREAYKTSALNSSPDDFVFYRVIGNDLPPRHEAGQSLRNLRFILENEVSFEGCEKRFVVNRIVDSKVEKEILELLREYEMPFLHIPFKAEEYAEVELDFDCLPARDFLNSRRFSRHSKRHQIRLLTAVNRLRNNYVMHNNGARNVALNDGRSRAKWILPFDGNCFFTPNAWDELRISVTSKPWYKYFIVPMARIQNNDLLLGADFSPPADEEPQLLFRSDAMECFNESFPYGRFPKIEMFWRLGIPGPWNRVTEKAWDPPRRDRSPEARQFALAGWVARLFSGVTRLEIDVDQGPSNRGDARREAILALFSDLDKEILGEDRLADYLPK